MSIAIADIVGRINISMGIMPTVRTGEGMATTDTAQTAARTILAGVPGVYLCHYHAMHLSLPRHGLTDKAMLPQAKATTQSTPTYLSLLRLRHMQILKDEDGVMGSPLDKGVSGLLSKGAGAMALLATKPFEKTPYRAGIFLLCLTGRKFGLESRACLGSTAVLDLDGFAAHKEGSSIRVNRYQGIGFTQVNTHRENALRVRNVEGQRETPDQLPVTLDDREAIKLFGLLKRGFEILWNGVGEVLTSAYRPDRERAIRAEISITPTHTNEEEGTCFLKQEGTGSRLLVGLCCVIGPCYQTDSRDRHLCIQRALHGMIVCPLQGQSTKRVPIMVAGLRQVMLHLSERLKRCLKIGVCLYDKGDGALNVHTERIPHKTLPVNSRLVEI